MTDRVNRLRDQSLAARECISAERAQLITRFYAANENSGLSVPVLRARAFEYILKHKAICINDGELIVGERGPAPKATSTYPEICLHSLDDLDILDRRDKVSFSVDDEVRRIYREEVIPYWNGRSNRDRIMGRMTTGWMAAYRAGIFTEFQEQRAPGHTVLGNKMYHKGFLDLKQEIAGVAGRLDFSGDPDACLKGEELKAMDIACDAIIMYAGRHADLLERMADEEKDEHRRKELISMASVCRRVPANAPETFHEMLQHYWFIHLGVVTELNPWDSFNPGRLDQHLWPVFSKETEAGTLTDGQARELLGCFWVKFNNHPAPPKVGVTAQESNTYTDFSLINLGGLTPEGSDAVNPVSYLILDVIGEMRTVQPSSMIQVSRKTPDSFVYRALDIIKTGFGQPSVFNADAIVEELIRQGKDIVDARNGGASGCVETGAFGTECYWLTGYFNLVKIFEVAMNNGVDPRTGEQVGPKTGEPSGFARFDDLVNACRKQVEYFADIKIKGNNIIETIFATHLPVPFLSLLIDDCITTARDYNAGGARYNTSYIQGVGLGSMTDILTSVRYNIYDTGRFSWDDMLSALKNDFEGYGEMQYDMLYNTPKYGNDDDYADTQAMTVFEMFHDAVSGWSTPRGGIHRINMLPTTSHVYFGSVTGATPDGRNAFIPLSEGISPVQGSDRHGPTAVLKSAAVIDHLKTGGTLLNQKFSPEFFGDEGSYEKLTALIRGYFLMNGHHIQFNVVDAGTLREAQKHPELFRDLIVRVAGYSDYFNDLGEDLQNEIIRRTEHGSV